MEVLNLRTENLNKEISELFAIRKDITMQMAGRFKLIYSGFWTYHEDKDPVLSE